MTSTNQNINNTFMDNNIISANGDIHFSQYETDDDDDDNNGIGNDPKATEIVENTDPGKEDERLINLPSVNKTTLFTPGVTVDDNPTVDKNITKENTSTATNGSEKTYPQMKNSLKIVFGQKKSHNTLNWKKIQPNATHTDTSFFKTVTPLDNIKRNLFIPAKDLLIPPKENTFLESGPQDDPHLETEMNPFMNSDPQDGPNYRKDTHGTAGYSYTIIRDPQTASVNRLQPAIINPYAKNKIPQTMATETSVAQGEDNSKTNETLPKKINHEATFHSLHSNNMSKTLDDDLQLDNNHEMKPKALLNSTVWTLGITHPQRQTSTLPSELECLKTVILSQHSALEQSIKDLGKVCLNFTKIIEEKKEVNIKLMDDTRIPRSLRFKIELLTSPRYQVHPEFIRLKLELQTALNQFITNGTTIFREWSHIHIQLLIKDRCYGILQHAIRILNGLYSYWVNILKNVTWPEPISKYPLLLLLKIYFYTDYSANACDVKDYLELDIDDIIMQASKLITNNNDITYNQTIINQIDLDSLEDPSPEQYKIISETLSSFHSILYATTIELWEHTLQKSRFSEASAKLKAQMDAERITSATTATAQAITTAVENIQGDNQLDQATQLRIGNLEKTIKILQENLKHLSKQKNLKGSHSGPMTSQNSSTIPEMVDLTMALSQSPPNHPSASGNRKRKKNIQWNNLDQVIQYHPRQPATLQVPPVFAPSTTLNQSPHMNQQFIQHPNTTILQSAPPSFPTPPNPFIQNPFNQITYTPKNQRFRGGRSRGGRRGQPRNS